MNPKVDFYFDKASKWKDEYSALRSIALECKLEEELKWGQPCYTYNGANVVLIHGFKEYCAYLFFKGVLLKDPKKILIKQTENVQGPRQIRFTSVSEIIKLKSALKSYIKAATEIEKLGLKVEFKKTSQFKMPEEFENVLNKNAALKKAFYGLTPGRQRAYLLFFSQAKQVATRESRVSKYKQHILKGKGMDDE